MKIESSTDHLTGQISLWLWEEVSDGANTYWFDEGKMQAVHTPKGNVDFQDIKPFMVLPHREYKQVMDALATFLQKEKIEPKNKVTLEAVINANQDHINFAENIAIGLLKKINHED